MSRARIARAARAGVCAAALPSLLALIAVAVGCGKYGKPVRSSETTDARGVLSPQRGQEISPAAGPEDEQSGEDSR